MFDTEFSIRLTEKAYRIAYFDAESVISEGNLSVLVERVTDKEIENLKTQLAASKKSLDDLRDLVPEEMSGVMAYLDKVEKEFGDVNPGAIKLLGNKKKTAKIIGSAASAIQKMVSISKSLTDAFSDLRGALAADDGAKETLKANSEDAKSLSIEDFIKKHGLGKLDDKTFRKGIKNAYTPPPKPKGFFATIVRKLGFEAMPPGDAAFADEMMKVPFVKILEWNPTPAVTGVTTPEATGKIDDVVASATDDVGDLSGAQQPQDETQAPDQEGAEDESPEEQSTADQEPEDSEEPEQVDEPEAEKASELPKLSSLLFEPVDSEDRSKGMKMRSAEAGSPANAIDVALRNLSNPDLRSSYSGLKEKPNTANRKSFMSNLSNLKKALNNVTVESQDRGEDLILERWNKLAGIEDE
jgi:hypothetical protein